MHPKFHRVPVKCQKTQRKDWINSPLLSKNLIQNHWGLKNSETLKGSQYFAIRKSEEVLESQKETYELLGLSLNCIVVLVLLLNDYKRNSAFLDFLYTWLRVVLSKYMSRWKPSSFCFRSQFVVYYVYCSFSDSNGPSEWKIVERTNDILFFSPCSFCFYLSWPEK